MAVATPASAVIAVPSAAYIAPTVFPYRSAPYLAICAVLTLEYPVGAVPSAAAAFVAAPDPLSSAAYAAPTVFPYRSAPYLAISVVLILEYPFGAVPSAAATLAAFVAAPVSAAISILFCTLAISAVLTLEYPVGAVPAAAATLAISGRVLPLKKVCSFHQQLVNSCDTTQIQLIGCCPH